jgi:hypothetical protein
MSDTDWQGRPVPPNEADETAIKVWQVSPHPILRDGFAYVERSWRKMLDLVTNNLDVMLERESVAEDGLTLTFKVVEMTLGDYREIVEGSDDQ